MSKRKEREETDDLPGRHVVFQTAPLSLNSIARSYNAESKSKWRRKGVEGAVGECQLTYDEDDTKSFEVDG